MKRLKKSVATVLAFVMVWSLMSLQSFGATITKSTTWDFTKWTAQTLTNDYSYDNLTVTATSTKKVSINSGINLGGGGAVDYRSIAFTATGPCTISVNAKGGSTTRYLVLANSNGAEYGRIATGSSYGTGTFNYTGAGENLYIYSAGSGITLSSMSLTYSTTAHIKGDVNNDGKVDKADAAIVLKHISGVSTITDADQLAAANYNNDGVVNALDAVAILNNQYVPEETTETTTEGVALDTVAGYEPSGVTPDGVAEVVYQSDTDDYLLKDTSTNCSATWKNSFETISSGKVTIAGYATPSKASSKWAFTRILGTDSEGNSVYFALGTDADKNISLCLSDGTYVSTDLAITANQKYTYEVFTEKGLPDTAFMLRNIDRKFYVYYDPDDLDNVKLFSVDKDSRFVADARPYIEVHRAKQDQDELDASFIKYQELEGKRQRVEMMQRTEDLMKKYGTHPEQNGLNMPPIKGLNMKNEKCKNRSVPVEIGGYEKEMSNLDELDLAEEYDKYINSKIDFDKYKDL